MNNEILYNIGLLMNNGANYEDAVVFAVNFYMYESLQETENDTIH